MIADTSRSAYRSTNRTAGQERVLSVLQSHTAPLTRHEIAEKGRLPLQSVCGRINELLQSGDVQQLDATKDGRRLLQISQPAPTVLPLRASPPPLSAGCVSGPAISTTNAAAAGRGSGPANEILGTSHSADAATHTTMRYTVDGVTRTLRVKGDPLTIMDYTRGKFYPDVQPSRSEPAFQEALQILRKK